MLVDEMDCPVGETEVASSPPSTPDEPGSADGDGDGSNNTGEKKHVRGAKRVSRDRYRHVTYCSLCFEPRTDLQAVALCELCPRILCRGCAAGLGVKIPAAPDARDTTLPADTCLCLTWDSNFPKPPEGTSADAHLLQQLFAHDLSLQFREQVDIAENPGYLGVITRNEMMDLGTVNEKMVNKQYQTTRGQRMFRRDVKQVWFNCRKFAGYKPEDEAPVAGIVACTLILEAMVDKFYRSYIPETALTFDEDSWLNTEEHTKQHQTQTLEGPLKRLQARVDDVEYPVAAAECEDSDEETVSESGSESEGVAETVGTRSSVAAARLKRKFCDESSTPVGHMRPPAGGYLGYHRDASLERGSFSTGVGSTAERKSSEMEGLVDDLCNLADIGNKLLLGRRDRESKITH